MSLRPARAAAFLGLAGALGVGGGLAAAWLAPGWDAPALPEHVRFSLLAVGDSGHLEKASPWLTPQRAVGDALAATHRARPAARLLLLGDNFYPDGLEQGEAEARIAMNLVAPLCTFLDLSAPQGARVEPRCDVPVARRLPIPVRAVLGNHDWRASESPDLEQGLVPQYLANWRLEKGSWLEETDAGVSLVYFESTRGRTPAGGEELRRLLAESKGPWRIVVSHHPIDDSERSKPLRAAIAAAGVPVALWLAGHGHNLQLSEPGEPGAALQVIAGSGSHATGIKYEIPGRRFFRKELGYARVDLVTDPSKTAAEELVVSLVAVRPVPAAIWDRAEVVARWAVDGDLHARRLFEAESDPITREEDADDAD